MKIVAYYHEEIDGSVTRKSVGLEKRGTVVDEPCVLERDALARIGELESGVTLAIDSAAGYRKERDQLRAELAALKAQEPVAAVGMWSEGRPPHPYGNEWFVARLKDGRKSILRALDEDHSYDYTTADESYLKADWVIGWAQFSDSCYLPYDAPVVSTEQQGVAGGYPHEEMDALATARFKVGASSWSVMPFAVRAGDGDQEIYRGSKSDCESVARKLAGAFLDGGIALIAMLAAAPAPSTTEGQGDE